MLPNGIEACMSRNNSDNEHFVKIVLSAHCMFEGQEAKRLNVRLNSTAKNKSNCEHEKLPLADLQKKSDSFTARTENGKFNVRLDSKIEVNIDATHNILGCATLIKRTGRNSILYFSIFQNMCACKMFRFHVNVNAILVTRLDLNFRSML